MVTSLLGLEHSTYKDDDHYRGEWLASERNYHKFNMISFVVYNWKLSPVVWYRKYFIHTQFQTSYIRGGGVVAIRSTWTQTSASSWTICNQAVSVSHSRFIVQGPSLERLLLTCCALVNRSAGSFTISTPFQEITLRTDSVWIQLISLFSPNR